MVELVPGVLYWWHQLLFLGCVVPLPSCMLMPVRLTDSWESSTPAPCSCGLSLLHSLLGLVGRDTSTDLASAAARTPPPPPGLLCPHVLGFLLGTAALAAAPPGCGLGGVAISTQNPSAFPFRIPCAFCPLRTHGVSHCHHGFLRMTYLWCHLRLCIGKQGLRYPETTSDPVLLVWMACPCTHPAWSCTMALFPGPLLVLCSCCSNDLLAFLLVTIS